MGALVYLVIAFLGGAVLPFQAGLNVQLGKAAGSPSWSALISFATGTVALALVPLALRAPLPSPAALRELPWWCWMGGVLGGVYVSSAILAAPRLGAAALIALVVAGQMTASLAIDRFGLVGFPAHPLTLARLIGAVLLIGGVVLIRLG